VTGARELRLDFPERAAATFYYPLSAEWDWREAVTVTADGVEHGPLPIVDETVKATLPDDYLGVFEVHLLSAEGTRTVAVEGRRLPLLTNDPVPYVRIDA
jgi:hypothetical protein